VAISTIRRNLQREHVTRLIQIVLGPKQNLFSFSNMVFYLGFEQPAPADARALARHHLKGIDKRIKNALAQDTDAMTQAHLDELHEQISKTLEATLQVNEP
jgi:hypothetical protein